MSFVTRVNSTLTRVQSGLKSVAARRVAASNKKAKQMMARVTNQTQRLRIKTEADKEKARVYKELREAQVAAKNAADALKHARTEAGDLTAMERLERGIRSGVSDFKCVFLPAPRRRTTMRRDATRRKPRATARTATTRTTRSKTRR